MIDFLDSVLGSYTPVLNPDGFIAAGFAGVDFPYLFRAFFLLVVIYSVLRIIGGCVCKMY